MSRLTALAVSCKWILFSTSKPSSGWLKRACGHGPKWSVPNCLQRRIVSAVSISAVTYTRRLSPEKKSGPQPPCLVTALWGRKLARILAIGNRHFVDVDAVGRRLRVTIELHGVGELVGSPA